MSISERLAKLSPEKRQVLLQKLNEGKAEQYQNTPKESTEIVPLSSAQQRVWLFEKFNSGSTAYNIVSALRVTGPLDIFALEWAFQQIVNRHDIFRTCFVQRGDVAEEIEQRVLDQVEVKINCVSVDDNVLQDRAQLETHVASFKDVMFSLSELPLFRLTVLHGSENSSVVLLVLHHILADGWSLRLIEQDLSHFYQAHLDGHRSDSPSLKNQYRDYVLWQSNWLKTDRPTKQLNYWKSVLQDAPCVLPLCNEELREQAQSLDASSLILDIPKPLLDSLRAYATESDTSLFMLLLSTFKATLSLFAGVEDLTVGTPIANRNRQQFEEVVGLFSNTLAIRSLPRRELSFTEYLGDLRTATVGAYSNQDLPFDKIVDEVVTERASHYSPLFQVLFALQAVEDSALQMSDLSIEPVHLKRSLIEFDLVAELFLTDSTNQAVLSFRTELYSEEFIRALWQAAMALAGSFIEHPETTIAEHFDAITSPLALSGVKQRERDRDQNDSGAEFSFTDGGSHYSYPQITEAVSCLAASIPLHTDSDNSLLLVAATPMERMVAVLAAQQVHGDCGIADFACLTHQLGLFVAHGTKTIVCYADGNPIPEHIERVDIQPVATMLNTSGQAKEVVSGIEYVSLCVNGRVIGLTQEQLSQSADFLAQQALDEKGVLFDAGVSFDLQLCLLNYALAANKPIACIASSADGSFETELLEIPIDKCAVFVSPDFVSSLSDSQLESRDMRRAVLCGALPNESTLNGCAACFGDAQLGGVFLWVNKTGELAFRGDFSHAGVINALDDSLPEFSRGELVLSAADGQRHRTGLSCVHAGDLRELAPATGQRIWLHGELCDLQYIARTVLSLGFVSNCIAQVRTAQSGELKLVCYVVVDQKINEQQLHEKLSGLLSSPQLPDATVMVNYIPLLASGDVDFKKLEKVAVLQGSVLQWDGAPTEGFSVAWQLPKQKALKISTTNVIQELPPVSSDLDSQIDARNRKKAIIHGGPIEQDEQASSCLTEILQNAAQEAASQEILFIEQAGEKPAVCSYQSLYHAATKVAGSLQAKGFSSGDIVVLQIADNLGLTTAFWGCVLCGVVPIVAAAAENFHSDDPAADKILQVCQSIPIAGILACSASYLKIKQADSFQQLGCVITEYEQALNGPEIAQPHIAEPQDTALMLLTSGSTGMPKTVMQSHHALIRRTLGEVAAFGFDAGEVSFNWMPMDHVGGLVMHHLTYLYLGAKQIHCPTSVVLADSMLWIEYLSEYRATTTWAPNFAYSLVNERINELGSRAIESKYDLSALRFLYNGGEAVIAQVAQQFSENLTGLGMQAGTMKPVWGMSETCSGVIVNTEYDPLASMSGDVVNVGTPLPGVNVRIVDESDNILNHGDVGRLQIGGEVITHGYRNNDEATRLAFTTDGWFCTGDLARIDDGRVTITGREKDLVIVNGKNYHCQEIEQSVDKLQEVLTAHVAACPIRLPQDASEKLAIFYTSHAAEVDEAELATIINRAVLSEIGVPVSYAIRLDAEQFSRTSIGKIQRNSLLVDFAAGLFEGRLYDLQSSQTLPNWFFKSQWLACNTSHLPSTADTLLVVGMSDDDFAHIGAPLLESYQNVIRVELASHSETIDRAHFRVDQKSEESWKQVLRSALALSSSIQIVYAAALYWDTDYHKLASLVEAQDDELLIPLLQLAKGIQMLGDVKTGIQMQVLSLNAFRLDSDVENQPVQGMLNGFVQSLSQEIDSLKVQQIDLAVDWQNFLPGLRKEIQTGVAYPLSALRNGRRYQRVLKAVEPKALPSHTRYYDTQGFHLVIGGLGGIGGKLVESLLSNVSAHVLVIGRSSAEVGRHQQALQNFQQAGDRFAYQSVDICDVDGLAQAIRHQQDRWQLPLLYLTNAAGENHAIELKNIDASNPLALMRSKLQGVVALQQALESSCASTFTQIEQIHIGSVQGHFGGAGLSLYAATNSFLSAWCEYQQGLGLPASCFEFSMWDDLGLTEGYRYQQQTIVSGFNILSPQQGVLSTRLLANADLGCSYLIGLDSSKLAMHTKTMTEFSGMRYSLSSRLVGDISDCFGNLIPVYLEGDDSPLEQSKERALSALETRLAGVWSDVLKLSAEVTYDDDFFELGGNSLHITRLANGLKEQFGIELNMQSMFENCRLDQMAKLIENEEVGVYEPIPHRDRSASEPASFSQHRLWFLDRMQGGSHEYNILSAAVLTGQLDADLLSKALRLLVQRHTVLRTGYSEEDGRCVQHIQSETDLNIELIDMTQIDINDQPSSLQSAMQAELNTPFDLSQDPVLRIKLLALDSNRHALLFCMHHIASDGWSMSILSRDFMCIYDALLSDQQVELPELPIEYTDYAHWQYEWQNGSDFATTTDYWLEQLRDVPPLINLPTDFARKQTRSASGSSVVSVLDKDLTKQLKRFCLEQGISLFMLLQSSFAVLLSKWSGVSDIPVATPVAGRDHPDLENLVGFFVNTLVIRNRCDSSQSLQDFFMVNKKTILDAFYHQSIPFDSLIEKLNVERSVSHPPLVQTMFALQNFDVTHLELTDLAVEPLDMPLSAVRFDLELIASEADDTICLHWNFAQDLFLSQTIERMSDGFNLLLGTILSAPETSLADVLLTAHHVIDSLGKCEKYRPQGEFEPCLLDARQQVVPTGAVGELCFVSQDQHGAQSLHATGELARIDGDNTLMPIGAKNKQVWINGYEINLQQIENLIASLEQVSNCLVVQADEQDFVTAYVSLIDSPKQAAVDEIGLFKVLQPLLPDYMHPRAIGIVDECEFDQKGGLNLDQLPEVKLFVRKEFVLASTDIEKTLAAIWCDLLSVDEIGIWDNFFELGGNSLSLTRLVLEIQGGFDRELSIKDIYDHPTISQQAVLLEASSGQDTAIVRNQAQDSAALSFSQQQIWLVHQSPEIVSQYNVPYAFKIMGDLDQTIVEQVFATIIERHEILRTTYHEVDGIPMQRVNQLTEAPVEIVNLTDNKWHSESGQLQEMIHQRAKTKFGLSEDLMIRVTLFRLSDDEQVLLVNLHHIAADGWSMNILGEEFSRLYSAYLAADENPLPTLPIQYLDYALWQRQQADLGGLKQQLNYWGERLKGAPPVHALPLDKSRPSNQDFSAQLINFKLESKLLEKLHSMALEHDATLFMLLHTAFAMLIAKWSGENDVVIAAPVSGRDRHETVSSIGCFTNTIALRTKFDEGQSFSEVLNQSKTDTLDALARSDVPFEQVVEHLNPPRNSAYNPVCQIKFVLQNHHQDTLHIDHVEIEAMDALGDDYSQLHFDLDLSIYEQDAGLDLFLSFKRGLFDEKNMQAFTSAYLNLLKSITLAPTADISSLSLLSNDSQRDLILSRQGEMVARGREQNILQVFLNAAEKFPDQVAVEMGSISLSYAGLDEKSTRLAAYLQAQGVGAADWVLLHMSRSVPLLVAMLAVWKAGAAYIPIDTANSSERVRGIIEDATPKIVLADEHFDGNEQLETAVFTVDQVFEQDWLAVYKDQYQPLQSELIDSAYAIYTSGSSGKPKGVDISHSALIDYCAFASEHYYEACLSGSVLATSHSFDLAVPCLVLPLMHGHTVKMFATSNEIVEFGELIEDKNSKGVLIRLTPMHLGALLKLLPDSATYPTRHVFVIGGDVFPLELATQLQRMFPNSQIYNHYGPTEATVGCCIFDVSANIEHLTNVIPIGRPMENTQLFVLDENLQHCPAGVPGELCIVGSGLAKGYINQPQLTAESFIEHAVGGNDKMYRTGDRVRYRQDGNIEYLGRLDDQVKVSGYRIELKEIQAVLQQQHESVDAHVGVYGAKAEQKIVAYLAADKIDVGAVSEQLSLVLPSYMVPSKFIVLEQMPLNDNGKIDKRRLPQIEYAGAEKSLKDLHPIETTTQQLVADIWSEVLDVSIDQIGRNSDFYELGGQSLMAMRVIAALRNQLEVDLTVADLFEAKELAQLCAMVDTQKSLRNLEGGFSEEINEQDTEITI